MKRKRIVLAAVAVVVVAVGGGMAVTLPTASDKGTDRGSSGLPPATAPIERGDLSDSTQKQGTLGYSKERKINAGAMGTITWVPGAGASVARDGRLYEVDGKPVRLMYGTTPMYRTLRAGDKGDDVRQLKETCAPSVSARAWLRTTGSPPAPPMPSSAGRRTTTCRGPARSAPSRSRSPPARYGSSRRTPRSATLRASASRC